MDPCEELPSSTQSSSCDSRSAAHAPVPRVRDRTANAVVVDNENGVTVSVAVIDAPAYDDVILTVVEAETVAVSITKVALRAPAATVTVAGTFATAVLSLGSCTNAPPPGAALASVTVPCGCPWP